MIGRHSGEGATRLAPQLAAILGETRHLTGTDVVVQLVAHPAGAIARVDRDIERATEAFHAPQDGAVLVQVDDLSRVGNPT